MKRITILSVIIFTSGLFINDTMSAKQTRTWQTRHRKKNQLTRYFEQSVDTHLDIGATAPQTSDQAEAQAAGEEAQQATEALTPIPTPTTPEQDLAPSTTPAFTPAPVAEATIVLPEAPSRFEQPLPSQTLVPAPRVTDTEIEIDEYEEPTEIDEADEMDEVEEIDEMHEVAQPERKPLPEKMVYRTEEQVESAAGDTFDANRKRQEVEKLVEKGINYLKSHKPHEAFHTFTHDKKFRTGELYLFAFDSKGVCLAHGQESNLVWKNLYNLKDTYGTLIVQEILRKAREGGGWLTYHWRNATKNTYVKEVRIDNKTYILGSGYYPHSKPDAVVNLVKGAVALFNTTVKQGRPIDEAFSTFSYPLGRFVFGDLYLYALDFQGIQVAHGEIPGIIGTNAWNYQDSTGKYVNQEIIAKLKNISSGGVWVEYLSKNARKRAYAEKVVDAQGKEYFIACGYYPDANRKQVEELVRRGYQFMKRNGKTQAVREFNDKANQEFRYGDLYLFVYDMKGNVVANGNNPALVGQNQYNQQDIYGNYYVRDMIKKANDGGGSIDFKSKNSFISVYVEKINLGVEQFVIGSGVYPVSKQETMVLIAKSGASYLQSNDEETAFAEFTKVDGKFVRGDLAVFVFDGQGICYVYGDDYSLIWRNLINLKDDNGKPYVQLLINTAKRGAGQVTYTLNGDTFKAHVEPVNKGGKFYVVGSGYYE